MLDGWAENDHSQFDADLLVPVPWPVLPKTVDLKYEKEFLYTRRPCTHNTAV